MDVYIHDLYSRIDNYLLMFITLKFDITLRQFFILVVWEKREKPDPCSEKSFNWLKPLKD